MLQMRTLNMTAIPFTLMLMTRQCYVLQRKKWISRLFMYTTGDDVYCVRMSCRASYADQVLAPPPIFDKDNNPLVLTAEIPRYHPVKVKFEIQKGRAVLRSRYYLIIKAIQVLEDIPSPFANVENF